MFQQDSAPAHRARETMMFLRRETRRLYSTGTVATKQSIPDFNPVDYKVWAILQYSAAARLPDKDSKSWRTATVGDSCNSHTNSQSLKSKTRHLSRFCNSIKRMVGLHYCHWQTKTRCCHSTRHSIRTLILQPAIPGWTCIEDADDDLFSQVLYNNSHVLNSLLPMANTRTL